MKRLPLSLALFVLICFFLPWLQVSCTGAGESFSGLDMARRDDGLLWLIPLLMLLVIFVWSVRFVFENIPGAAAFIALVSAGISAYLMYRERASVRGAAGLGTRWTPFYWLGLTAAVLIGLSAIWYYLKKLRSP